MAADAEYGEVVEVGLEFILLLESDADGFEEAVMVDVEGRAAVPTDYVMVSPVVGELVLVGAAAEVYFDEKALALEELDGAVDGGDVDERVGLLDPFVDVLGGHVAGAGCDGGQDHDALGGKTEARASEGVEEFICLGQSLRSGEVASSCNY